MRAPWLTVAAAQPACLALDVAGNAETHARVVLAAQARVVVFPELSLTGYELDAAPVQCDHKALIPIIALLAIDGAGARPAYRKTWFGGNEPTQFHAGDGPTVLDVDGWRLGLGICKDTGAPQHVAGTAALNVDAYLAGLVHLPQELPEQEARAVVIVRACRAFVVFASFAGPTGDVFAETAGSSANYSAEGLALARTGPRRCCPGHPRLRSSHCRNVYRSRSAIARGLAEHDHFVPIGDRATGRDAAALLTID